MTQQVTVPRATLSGGIFSFVGLLVAVAFFALATFTIAFAGINEVDAGLLSLAIAFALERIGW